MSLTVASTFARRGRQARAIPPVAHSSIGTAVTTTCRQQTRSYRFGRLSSYVQHYMPSDIYTRHRSLEYNKYCDNLYQRPSCDKPSLAEDAKSTLKRVVNNYWHTSRRPGQGAGRYLNTDAAPRRTPDNPEGIRPGQNIEDVERAPLEHLLFGDKKIPRATRQPGRSAPRPQMAPFAPVSADGDYIIDPISNRKVPKHLFESGYLTPDQGVEIPVKTSKPYNPIFQPFKAPELKDAQIPYFSDGPPPEEELRLYGQQKIWDPVVQPPQETLDSKQSDVESNLKSSPQLWDAVKSEHKDVRWHRNDTIASASTNTAWLHNATTPEYPDLHLYHAVRYQEPDGKPADEQATAAHEDLELYHAVKVDEPNGRYSVESDRVAKPQELNKYGAIRSHEPDGKYKIDAESSADSQELNAYGPVLNHEPDGKYAAEYTEAPDQAELEAYSKPFLSHEPDGKYAANYVIEQYDADELAKYRTPFFSHEPDGKYAAAYVEPQPDASELAQYTAYRSHEPDGKYAAEQVEEKYDSGELAGYGAFRSHEPDGKYAAMHAAPAPPADTQTYQAFRSHEPDGKYAAEASSADPTKEKDDLANHEAFGYEDAETRPLPQESRPSEAASDLRGSPTLERPESAADASAYEDYDPAELRKYQAVMWNEPDGKPALTGNYVRDFPEEFSKSWSGTALEDTSALLSSEQKTSDKVIQPALERCSNPKASSGASSPSESTAQQPQPQPINPAQPALYKILVYDPTMQCIETAETTSVVPDSSAPLTPAEVLLRISNPAKFFPHFAPLQAQGFEIVSGSGDVLIFRKVREAVAEAISKSEPLAAEVVKSSTTSASAVNPIDMTGERRDEYPVVTGRFASPTGFVNFDLPVAEDARRSSYQREEAPRRETATAWESGAEQKVSRKGKRSMAKKAAVGAAYLAGGAYSVGVVSEYFKKGGMDGKGPRGF